MLSPSSLNIAAFCFISSTNADIRASICTACLENTCKILETLLPFSITQNCINKHGKQSSLFSWLGLA